MRIVSKTILILFIACTAFAQSDRGVITGTVTDPSQATIAGAKVEVRNVDNGSTFNAQTSGAGSFTIPSVPSGKYTVTISAPGFKVSTQTDVAVQLNQTVKLDVSLQIGQSTESVTVSGAADILKTDNAEQSMNISGRKVNDLPLNFTAGSGQIRNWLSFTYLAPGVSSTTTNGNQQVNGIPGGGFKIYLEGQDSTSNNDANWTSTVAAASVEAITEFAVQSSNFSAEYGQVAGGLYNFTTKSGTNQFHGSLYEEWGNEVLDARRPFNHVKDKDRKNDYGFSVGGPVWIPKIYNGRNRSFFFFNWERFANNLASAAQTGTVPTAAYRKGDFGCALFATTTNCTGPTVPLTDATSGYQFLQNQIFDPLTNYTDANGRILRTPFANNVIPTNRLDPVALKILALIPQPVSNQNTLNWAPNVIANTQQAIPSLKIDQNVGSNLKTNFYWNRQTTNQIAAADGLPIPLTSARPKLVQGNQYRVNLDRTFNNSVVAHLGLGFYRFKNPDSSPEAVLKYDVVGQLGLVGSATGVGFPAISGLNVNNQGGTPNMGPTTADRQTTNMASITGSASWLRGRHSFKTGFEFKQQVYSDENYQGAQGVYGFSGNQTAIPFLGTTTVGSGATTGAIGSGLASFMLGTVNSTTVNPPKNTQLRRITQALYFMDSYKVTPKLTIEIGMRWDRVPMGHELWDRQSEIGLTTPNPNAGNLPGGFIFAGYGEGRCNCQFTKTYNYGFAPRLSVAYQLGKSTVIRAGWGINYSAGDSWAYLNGGYSLNGLGYNSIQTSAPGFGQVTTYLKDGLVYNPSVLSQKNLNPGINTTAGQLNTFSAVWGGLYNSPSAGRPARINNWNVSVQRQLSKTMSLEAAYVGNRGVWELANGLLPLNTITPEVLAAKGLDLNNANTRTLMTSQIGSAAAVAAGFKLPYAGFPTTATVAQSLRPFPMYNSGLAVQFNNAGSSWYDALQMKFLKRMGHGLDVSAAYTHAKTLNLGNSGINGNAFNRDVQKGLDPVDQPNIFVTAITFQVPRMSSNKFVRSILADWTWGATLRYASGPLIQAPSSSRSQWGTYTFASNTPQIRNTNEPLYLTDINCRCIDPNNPNQRILNPNAWIDVNAGQLSPGSRYYSDYRGMHSINENMNFGRTFRFRERIELNIRAEFFNVFNRVTLGTPSSGNPTQSTTINNQTGAITGFGYYAIGNTSNFGGQRTGDLVARIRF